jgi:glycosyltransferase involved in cell wall biosynthesis
LFKLSVVLPAFNEADRIEANVLEAWNTLSSFGCEFEILIVDDGSADDTAEHALRACSTDPERIRVIRCTSNQGKGNALICGTRYASGDFVAFLDADLDLHPQQLAGFIDVIEELQVDLVVGSKFHPRSVVDYPALRRIYSLGYYALIQVLFGLPLRDTQTGIKLFKVEVLRDILPRLLVKRFAFDIELLVNAAALGYKIGEAPVTLQFQRTFGRLNYRDVWRILVDTLAIFYRLKIIRYYDRVEPKSLEELSATRSAELLEVPVAPGHTFASSRLAGAQG